MHFADNSYQYRSFMRLVNSAYGTGTAAPKDGRLVSQSLRRGPPGLDCTRVYGWGVWMGPECVSDRTS